MFTDPHSLQLLALARTQILASPEFATAFNNAIVAGLNTVLTTRGDMLRKGATDVERFALGATDTIVSSDGTDVLFRTKAALNVASLNTENQTLTGGVAVTSKDLGTITTGTLTLDMGDRPQQHYINGGAHTLAPGSIVGSCLLDITNNGDAGAITTSGWDVVDGDSFTTTDTDSFRCHCSVGNAGSLLLVKAMQ